MMSFRNCDRNCQFLLFSEKATGYVIPLLQPLQYNSLQNPDFSNLSCPKYMGNGSHVPGTVSWSAGVSRRQLSSHTRHKSDPSLE